MNKTFKVGFAALLFSITVPMVSYAEGSHSKNDHMEKMMHSGGGSNYTLVQVMDDLASQISRIQTGILKGNRLMIKQGAQGIAKHPKPKGGLKPYLKKNVESIKKKVPVMDKVVHQTALKMVEVAETESISRLQEMMNTVVNGCIDCHEMFRD